MTMELIPFQVEDNDIVLAENEAQAISILKAYTGSYDENDELEATDLSDSLHMKFVNEEGEAFTTLGEYISDMKEPQYVVGWE